MVGNHSNLHYASGVHPKLSPFFPTESVYHRATDSFFTVKDYDITSGMVALTPIDTFFVNIDMGGKRPDINLNVGIATHKCHYSELEHCYEEV